MSPGDSDTATQLRIITQAHPCNDSRTIPTASMCNSCKSDDDELLCRFVNMRRFVVDANKRCKGVTFWHPRASVSTLPAATPFRYKTISDASAAERDNLKALSAQYLLPLIALERQAIHDRDNAAVKPRELDTRSYCDSCLTAIFFGSMMCRWCGWEFCSACFQLFQEGGMSEIIQLPRQRSEMNPYACTARPKHVPEDFLYTTHFTLLALDSVSAALTRWATKVSPKVTQPITISRTESCWTAPQLAPGSQRLSAHLADGIPVVVHGLETREIWSPEWFIRNFGNDSVILVDCESEEQVESTVKKFFKTFGKDRSDSSPPLKLADWPPQAEFKRVFRPLYDAFYEVLPFPEYMNHRGKMNMAAYYAYNAQVPDLGPKMYIAQKTDTHHHGSTRLHMDMSDTVNILMHSSNPDKGAIWDIFKRDDAAKLNAFIQQRNAASANAPNTIHAQGTYLTKEVLSELAEQGVFSFEIHQKPGDAVVIPAGCAHQVANVEDCIKVATDFVSPENIHVCQRLTEEFRAQNIREAWKDDALQLPSMMWHVWMALNE